MSPQWTHYYHPAVHLNLSHDLDKGWKCHHRLLWTAYAAFLEGSYVPHHSPSRCSPPRHWRWCCRHEDTTGRPAPGLRVHTPWEWPGQSCHSVGEKQVSCGPGDNSSSDKSQPPRSISILLTHQPKSTVLTWKSVGQKDSELLTYCYNPSCNVSPVRAIPWQRNYALL
jgi:hypothetical protein